MKVFAGLCMALVFACKPIAGPVVVPPDGDVAAPVANDSRLKETIAARKADVFTCYEKRRLDDPSLKGEVLITWTVKSDGTSTVSFAADIDEVLTGTKSAADRRLVDDAALQACVTALALRFPVDDQPQRKRSVPFRFGLAP